MTDSLQDIAQRMVATGKGILAADESTGSIKKRLESIGVESTPETRRDYREMLFRADAMRQSISGVILFDETLRQNAADGTPLRQLISDAGALIGIKVDTGAMPLPNFPGETITEGLDGLAKRIAEYHDLGARFAKWRGVIAISNGLPTWGAVRSNAHALARYAATLPGRRHRPDRRAGSGDGRRAGRPFDRALPGSHALGAGNRVLRTQGSARRSDRHHPQAQHGH